MRSKAASLGFIDVDIAAVVLYDQALDDATRGQVEIYLQQEYLGVSCGPIPVELQSFSVGD